ncbi:sigma-70 family RNA polymerase sigma factor [Phytohabitans sp. ZYX-F-186]|uniref:Sigma-70 family RNA polymerase sigma factor n=1 Tax=Phytohabitans maris TaxID=3071409 RepID=A0ABU0ZIE8_9ACTN|nr:sigma-70 family RNA polymerase sigma factor [Phytohabitans sp. ZYX-F-186]MDQ7905722.1 sigma-70 family RNA polymerase sigma factor [Phytohabitans sp. ZYX-F-186]
MSVREAGLTTVDPHLERRMRALVAANGQPLFYFLLRLTHGQYELAEDLLQETMLRAWRNLAELPAEPPTVRRWLFTVARHLAVDSARARQARPPEVYGVDLSWVRAPDDAVDGLLDRFAVVDALRGLTAEQRAVLVELYFGGASVAEVAARIGIPEGTVRSRSFYALRAARGHLESAAGSHAGSAVRNHLDGGARGHADSAARGRAESAAHGYHDGAGSGGRGAVSGCFARAASRSAQVTAATATGESQPSPSATA